MLERLSSRAADASPKTKVILENNLKTWKTILKDDFTNQVIEGKSDFLNLQELKFPDFFENKY